MSTLTQSERQALNDIFVSMSEKEDFHSKLKEVRKELKAFLKYIFREQKTLQTHRIILFLILLFFFSIPYDAFSCPMNYYLT